MAKHRADDPLANLSQTGVAKQSNGLSQILCPRRRPRGHIRDPSPARQGNDHRHQQETLDQAQCRGATCWPNDIAASAGRSNGRTPSARNTTATFGEHPDEGRELNRRTDDESA